MTSYFIFIIIIIILLLLLLFSKIYIKLKFGFWSIQPVFHIYDFQYFLFPKGIIMHSLPNKNKYTNFKNIETILFSKISTWQKTKFIQFIKINYLQNKGNIFKPEEKTILPYFEGHNDICFYTCYTIDENIVDVKTNDVTVDKKITSVITGRPLHVIINNGNKNAKFDVYYVDYLCVDKKSRKKGIAPEMIQTHEYNQRHLNKSISVSLFKREGELTGIVPLTVYSSYGFHVNKWTKPKDLPGMYAVIQISSENIHFLHDFLQQNSKLFDIYIIPEVANILSLINSGIFFIYVILLEGAVTSCYFFKKTSVFIDYDLEVLTCFASINIGDKDTFIHGYKSIFWKIAEKNNIGYAAIENISHNNIIINNIIIKTHPDVISPTAYFFYNFAYPTFKSEKTLIIN
jgi:hypothetical protein